MFVTSYGVLVGAEYSGIPTRCGVYVKMEFHVWFQFVEVYTVSGEYRLISSFWKNVDYLGLASLK